MNQFLKSTSAVEYCQKQMRALNKPISEEEISNWLDVFNGKLEVDGRGRLKARDYNSYFVNWLKQNYAVRGNNAKQVVEVPAPYHKTHPKHGK